MRLLYLDWPHLPLRLELARHPIAAELIVLGGHPWEPGTVLDCSPAASRLGVGRGQALGSAHNLVPEAAFLPVEPDGYRATFEAALELLGQFTPAIEGEIDPRAAAFGQAWLGIEGLARLWGAEPVLVERVVATTASLLPGRPRVGIANTRFGAQVAAVVGSRAALLRPGGASPGRGSSPGRGTSPGSGSSPGRGALPDSSSAAEHGGVSIVPAGGRDVEAAFLAPLPIGLLPADQETRDRFRLFGLARIGQFAALDRSAVLARFGVAGGELHDLARGMDGRPLRPRRPIEHLRAEAELDPPVEELESLRFVLHHLCGTLCEQLAARGAGASRASLQLALERAAPVRYDQALPEPAAAPGLLERLLLARLEADPPQAPVERLSLELDGRTPAQGQQLGLFTPQLARVARLDWELASLAIRYGPDRLLQAQLRDPEAPIPEERFEWLPAGSIGEGSLGGGSGTAASKAPFGVESGNAPPKVALGAESGTAASKAPFGVESGNAPPKVALGAELGTAAPKAPFGVESGNAPPKVALGAESGTAAPKVALGAESGTGMLGSEPGA